MKQDDYYQLLGIERRASLAEVKRAFRERIREAHPDHRPDDGLANETTRELIEAYKTLSDAGRRKFYDLSLAPVAQSLYPVYSNPVPTRASHPLAIFASLLIVVVSAFLLAHVILFEPADGYTFSNIESIRIDENEPAQIKPDVFKTTNHSLTVSCTIEPESYSVTKPVFEPPSLRVGKVSETLAR